MTSFHQHCMLEDVLEMPHIVRCTSLKDLSCSFRHAHRPDLAQMRFQTHSERRRHSLRIVLFHPVLRLKARPLLLFFFESLANFTPVLVAVVLLELILAVHVADV